MQPMASSNTTPPTYDGYDVQPHQQVAALALTPSPELAAAAELSRPTTCDYAPSSGRASQSGMGMTVKVGRVLYIQEA